MCDIDRNYQDNFDMVLLNWHEHNDCQNDESTVLVVITMSLTGCWYSDRWKLIIGT